MWPALLGEGWVRDDVLQNVHSVHGIFVTILNQFIQKLRRRDPRWWLNVGRASPQFSCQKHCHLWVKHRTGSQGDKVTSLRSTCSPFNLWGLDQRANLCEDTMWDQKLGLQPQAWLLIQGYSGALSPVIWFIPEHPWDSAGWPHQSVCRNVIQTWTQLLMVESLL